jgi:hypothetical protein
VSLEVSLRALHEGARRWSALYRLALITRMLLALAFVPTALVKVRGMRFTSIGIESPVGFFFEAMYRTGAYWQFIGWAQLVAGVLLLIPQTATLGALLFFPVILNIFIITVALDFTGTWVVTGLMLLASLFLLCWDWHRLAPIIFGPDAAYRVAAAPVFPRIERIGFAVGFMGATVVLFWTRGMVLGGLPSASLLLGIGIGFVGGLMVLAGWWQAARRPALAA